MSVRWDPARYDVYADERSRPFFDLTSRIDAVAPRDIVDLGSGGGALTATLAARWPNARVHGIDSSPHMINRAADAADGQDRLTFELADLAEWMPTDTTDVVISNAALQWVPEHRDLLRQWGNALADGSWLAFQVPGNFDAPSHRLMRQLADSDRWRSQLHDVFRHKDAVDEPQDYLRLLLSLGFETQVWETTYLHVLPRADPVLEWVHGTGLRPALQALSPTDAAAFEAEYAAELRIAYPRAEHGTLFPFRRVFAVGVKRLSRV